MTAFTPIKNRWLFLAQWTGLNLLGWAIGIHLSVKFLEVASSIENALHTLPLPSHVYDVIIVDVIMVAYMGVIAGASIGLSQWLLLRRFKISILVWTSMTALGFGLGVVCSFALGFIIDRFVPPHEMEPWGTIGASIVSFAIVSLPQALVIRKSLSRPVWWWPGAHICGLLPAFIFGYMELYRYIEPLYPSWAVRSAIKKALVAVLPDDLAFWIIYQIGDGQWHLSLMLILFILGIAILPGIVLVNPSKSDPVTQQTD